MVDNMLIIKDDVVGLAEEILLLITEDGYNIDNMSPEELSELVDEYLNKFYEFINNEDSNDFKGLLNDNEDDDFNTFYKKFTGSIRNKELHIKKYLN